MNNSNLLVDAIKSGLGEMADKNALAIKVAQEIIEREFQIGQKLAGLIFNDKKSFIEHGQTLAEKIAGYQVEQEIHDRLVEHERDAARTLTYLEKYA
jgi:hypothetical protein